MKKILLAFLLLVVSVMTPVSAGASGIGGRPANPNPENPRTQSIFIHTFEETMRTEDEIVVANNTDQTNTIELYATDGAVTNTGAFTCQQRAEPHTDIGTWIRLEQASVKLEPNTSTKVRFAVEVPDRAVSGEHTGCIVLQKQGFENDEKGLSLQVRSAVRVVALLPGDLFKEVGIKDFTVKDNGRSLQYGLALTNVGNVSADVRASVTLKSVFGDSVGKESNEYPVLRNGKLDVAFAMDNLPFWGGFYTAVAKAEYDPRPYMFGIHESSPLTTVTSDSKTIFVSPHPFALLLIFLGLIVIGVLIYLLVGRLRSRRRGIVASWSIYEAGADDTLSEVAQRHGISSEALAWVNKIPVHSPLVKGQKLHVPPRGSEKEE